jgi:hypothetical protein
MIGQNTPALLQNVWSGPETDGKPVAWMDVAAGGRGTLHW